VPIAVLATPYGGAGKLVRGGLGPARLLQGGLEAELGRLGHVLRPFRTVELSPSEEETYGAWERVGLANGHLARLVHEAVGRGDFVLGLLADCNAMLGMLGGLQRSGDRLWPPRVGLLWIDAHADYNTPETSPSGMLGGMPVAVAAGKALRRLRLSSGMTIPLQSPDIVLAGVRDVDQLEGEAIASDGIHSVRPAELVHPDGVLRVMLDHLAAREDLIYAHVDLDILDPALAPAAGLPVPGGLSGHQLGRILNLVLSHPKVQALGIASYRPEDDAGGQTFREIMTAVIEGARGLLSRGELKT